MLLKHIFDHSMQLQNHERKICAARFFKRILRFAQFQAKQQGKKFQRARS